MNVKKNLVLLIATLLFITNVSAETLRIEKINQSSYALIGEIGGRTYENQALNANYGAIVTNDGVVLIDSGASEKGAEFINKEVQKVTGKKIRWVINTGSWIS